MSTARRIVLGVGGGIAAYKSCELLRRLRALGHDVTVVPTASALNFVGAATFEALSGHPVSTGVFSGIPDVRHVQVGQQADLVIIAPATADLLARAATGRADDLLTATLLVARAPVLMAPAMHTEMWTHPATVANVATLRNRGVIVVPPAVGRLTGTDSGPGRLPEAEQLAQLAELVLHRPDALRNDLAGRRILISAGGTREPLDPVRYLGNRSSGRQGYALALVAATRGAHVTLVAANTTLADPPGVRVQPVGTALELQDAMRAAALGTDAIVMNAAVADFRPAQAAAHKLKKHPGDGGAVGLTHLDLVENPDVLAGLVADRAAAGVADSPADRPRRPVLIGFAAETGDAGTSPLDYGRQKLARKGCDLLVVNRVDGGLAFGSGDNAAVILSASGEDVEVPFGPKSVLAAAVCDALAAVLVDDARPPADCAPDTPSR